MTDNTKPDRTGDPDTPPRRYEYLWRNKYLTAEAETLNDMIDSLRDATDRLHEMRSAGVVLDEGSAMADDYAVLVTTDPAAAERFGFEPVTDEDVVEEEADADAGADAEERCDDSCVEDDPQEDDERKGSGVTWPIIVSAATTGELRGCVYTRHLYQRGLPDLEMRDVPAFLHPEAAGLLYKLANEMWETREPFRPGQTILRDQGYLRFVTPVPIPGQEDLYRHPRLQIVEAEPAPTVTEAPGPHTEWTRV
jgi:hypothetical protein